MKLALLVLVAATGAARADAPRTCAPQAWADPWPYLDRPADPWLAVDNGKPRRVSLPRDRTGMMKQQSRAVCDAAHDHCLRDCTWLVTTTPTTRRASPYHVNASGAFVTHVQSSEPPPGFVAYRSVPVTRKNLAKGMLAVAVVDSNGGARDGGGRPRPDGQATMTNSYWDVGIVESIEWDRNLVRFEGVREPYFLTGTRVIVLRYDGGTVTKLPGVDDRAPAVADLYVPPAPSGPTDPWAQVGKDKQPLAVDDQVPLAGVGQDCAGANDHCLRSWVWFVTVDGDPVPARWTGKQFVFAEDPKRGIENPGMAYRTRPAKPGEVVAGAKVILFDNGRPSSEADAHRRRGWKLETLETVDRFTQKVQIGGGATRPLDGVRVMVLWWLPGEVATALP